MRNTSAGQLMTIRYGSGKTEDGRWKWLFNGCTNHRVLGLLLQVCDALEDAMAEGGNIVDHHGCDLFPER
jgi:hypothetical protein